MTGGADEAVGGLGADGAGGGAGAGGAGGGGGAETSSISLEPTPAEMSVQVISRIMNMRTIGAGRLALIILFFLLFLRLSLPLTPSQFVSARYRLRGGCGTTATRESSHPIFQTRSRSTLVLFIIVPSITSWIPPIGQLSRFGEFNRFISRSDGCDSIVLSWFLSFGGCWS